MKPLRVVVCGEVNSGKSTVINALLRGRVLPDLFGAKSRPFIHVRPGDAGSITARVAGADVPLDEMTSDALREAETCEVITEAAYLDGFEIIEMPFLNERDITQDQIAFVEAADLLVWTTIASQAWRLSEKTILDRCEKRPSAAVLVVSRCDKLRSDEDRGKLLGRMERETGDYFREIVMMHGKDTIIEAAATDDAAWETTAAPVLLGHLRTLAVDVREAKAAALAAVQALAAQQGDADDAAGLPSAEIVQLNAAKPEVNRLSALERAVQIAASPQPVAETAAEPAFEPEPEPEPKPEPETEAKAEAPVDAPSHSGSPEFVSVRGTGTPLPQIPARAAFAAIPKTPQISASVRQQIAAVLPAIHGCTAIGFAPLDAAEDVEFLMGEPDDWPEIGAACRAMYEAEARLDTEGEGVPIQSHMTLHDHQVLMKSYPRKGVALFFIARTARMNHALARTAFERLTRTVDQAR